MEGGVQEGIVLLLRYLKASIEENHKESWNFLYPDRHSNRIPLKHINHNRYCYKNVHDPRIWKNILCKSDIKGAIFFAKIDQDCG